jgi:hypothetical protein
VSDLLVEVFALPLGDQHRAVMRLARDLDSGMQDVAGPRASCALAAAGRVRVLHRHRPGPGASCVGCGEPWPCDDYRDTAEGLVVGLGR